MSLNRFLPHRPSLTGKGSLERQVTNLREDLLDFQHLHQKNLRAAIAVEGEDPLNLNHLHSIHAMLLEMQADGVDIAPNAARLFLYDLIDMICENGFDFIATIEECKIEAEISEQNYHELARGVKAFRDMLDANTHEQLLAALQRFQISCNRLPPRLSSRIQQPGEILCGCMAMLGGASLAYGAYALLLFSLSAAWSPIAIVGVGILSGIALMAIGAGIAAIYNGLNPTFYNEVKSSMHSLSGLFTFFNHNNNQSELSIGAKAVREYVSLIRHGGVE